MKPGRYYGSRDTNHEDIAKTFTDLGCSVLDLSKVGSGAPDLAVGLIGRTFLVEIKFDDGDLSPSQKRWHRGWRGSPVLMVKTADDCIAHVKWIRSTTR